MPRRFPALLAIVAGVALLVAPFVLFPHAGQPHCVNSVEPIDGAEVSNGAAVFTYDDLSADAKRAFDRARTAPDGRAAVYGERCPEEFVYTDYVREYYIKAEDERYVLETAGGGTFAGELFAGIGLALVGLALVVLGTHEAARGDTTQVHELAYGGLAGFGVVALLAAAADARLVLGLGLAALARLAAYLLVGSALPFWWAVSLGALASIVGWVVLASVMVHGSAVAVVPVPVVLTGLGIVGRALRRELLP